MVIYSSKSARAYELPSICTLEKVGIVDFLHTISNHNTRIIIGKEYNVPVIDMTTKTTELHCYTDDTRTEIDNTHLSIKGCTLIADMIAEETANLKLKISEKLK